ncbi:MAG: SRPBCC family protein [Hyphomonadaceae bacterium JAD_PAG50586_4]|nr:MAG: SRPBCC family protein [Hyphomonadaceae bacterium JAD_PAG50586_4]
MTKGSATHDTFMIEREYKAAPAKVFAAFSKPAAKIRWFGGPDDWEKSNYKLDFRVGGRESVSGGPPGGPVHSYDGLIMDIVENKRLIIAYEMHLDETRISVSLGTTEFRANGSGTRLVYTEQGVFLDGFDDAGGRERGTQELFDQLGISLDS